MSAAVAISLEDYLKTSYRPDCDYVDGELEERNLGEKDHSALQREIIFFFRLRQKEWGTFSFPEQRLQISAQRFRVPDVCITLGKAPATQVFDEPPFICIEILSKDDSLERLQARIDDYLGFGVPYVWVINPRTRRAWCYTNNGIQEAKDGVLRTENPALAVPLTELFAGLS
jgi:Uma2 family endonuclease